MLILGQKGANSDQKGPKMGGTRFFPVLSLGYFVNKPKMQFKLGEGDKHPKSKTKSTHARGCSQDI